MDGFIRENPIKMDDFGGTMGYPYFWKHPYIIYQYYDGMLGFLLHILVRISLHDSELHFVRTYRL